MKIGPQKYLQDISLNREGVMARTYNYLATLERLHLALWNNRGTDAAMLTGEIQHVQPPIPEEEIRSAACSYIRERL